MRIGVIAPPWFAVPPAGYGGIEWVVSLLADGLTERGHDVTLFASGGSESLARLEVLYEDPPSELIGDAAMEAAHLGFAYEQAEQFDIIHDHSLLGLLVAPRTSTPVVHTVHGAVVDTVRPLYSRAAGSVHFVNISRHQQSTMPDGCSTTVIYNAVDTRRYPFSAEHGKYLLWVGRICPEKGIVEAAEIARRAGLPLVVLAKINEQPEQDYFDAAVRPALDGVEFELLHQVPHDQKATIYRDALATLFPIKWPEPFGLVMTESMATGTPVIAFRHGSVPEVIEDRRTGFICESVDEAAEAVSRVCEIDRAACRERVELNFGTAMNLVRHEQLYERILSPRPHETSEREAGSVPVEGDR